MNRSVQLATSGSQLGRIFGGTKSSPTKNCDPEAHLRLTEENSLQKTTGNCPAEESIKPLNRRITSMAAVTDACLIAPILKSTSSLGSVTSCERKVQIALEQNQQLTVENWKELNRGNTYQMDAEGERSCCRLF